jgi:hypothetical protein
MRYRRKEEKLNKQEDTDDNLLDMVSSLIKKVISNQNFERYKKIWTRRLFALAHLYLKQAAYV